MIFEDFLSFDMSALITILVLIFLSYLGLHLYLKHRKETVLAIIISFTSLMISMYSITINLPLTPMVQILFLFMNLTILLLTIARSI